MPCVLNNLTLTLGQYSFSEPQNRTYFLNFAKDATQPIPFQMHRRDISSLHTMNALEHQGLILRFKKAE